MQLLVSDPGRAKKILKDKKIPYYEERVLLVQIPIQTGSLARFVQKLAAKGVNIGAAYQTSAEGSGNASVVLAVSHLGIADRVR